MHPVLFRLGDFPVATYGVCFGVGLFAGLLLATVRARRDGIPGDWAWDLGMLAMVFGVIGARLEYVRTHPAAFLENPALVFALRDGGLVFYGGFALTLAAYVVYARFRGLHFLDLTDLMAPSVALGHAIGRVGCIAAGCCYGRPTDGWWQLTFPGGSVAPAAVALVPTQVHEVLANLAISATLWVVPRRFRGQRFAMLLALYGSFRFVNELFRSDNRGSFLGTSLSNGQGTALLFLVAAAVVVAIGRGLPPR